MSTYITKIAKERKLNVVDAKTPLVIKVTAQDIASATQKSSKDCAFSRACKKQKGVKAAYIFRTAAYVEYPDRMVRYLLPPSMQKEIVSFDRAKMMDAGTFQLSPPGGNARMGAIRKRGAKRPGRHQPGSGTIKRKIIHKSNSIRTLEEPE